MGFNNHKNAASDNAAPATAPGFPALVAPPPNATDEELAEYVRARCGAIGLCKQLRLQYAWLAGVALLQAQTQSELKDAEWDDFCWTPFEIRARQARNLMRIARHFRSLDSLPEDCSLNGALRILSDREKRKRAEKAAPNPATTPPPSDRDGDTHGAGGTGDGRSDHGATTVAEPQAPPPDRGERAADLVDDIIRIVGKLGDENLELIEKVHGLLTGALDSADAAATTVDKPAKRHTRRKKDVA